MKVLETLRTEFEEELAAKDARILEVQLFNLIRNTKYKLQVTTFQLDMKYEF